MKKVTTVMQKGKKIITIVMINCNIQVYSDCNTLYTCKQLLTSNM